MKKRDVASIFLFQALTFGIYFLYWCWRSKNEVNQANRANTAPTIWWFLLPGGGFWWAWQYSQAVEKATKGKLRYSDSFLLFIVATLGVTFYFWWPTINNSSGHVQWGATLAVWGFFSWLAVLLAAIFPAAMQNRFNGLAKK